MNHHLIATLALVVLALACASAAPHDNNDNNKRTLDHLNLITPTRMSPNGELKERTIAHTIEADVRKMKKPSASKEKEVLLSANPSDFVLSDLEFSLVLKRLQRLQQQQVDESP